MKITRRRMFTALAAVATAGLGGLGIRSGAARYYDGPVSDHFDGLRFFDPHGSPPNSVAKLFRWYTGRSKAEWPAWAPSPYTDRPPARIAGTEWRISFVGHATVLLQTAGVNVLTDPFWSERASPFTFIGPKRVNDPGVAFDTLPPIDAVLVSHCHYDHLDVATLSRLAAAHGCRVVTPLGNDTIIRDHDPSIRVEAHDWGDRVELGPGVAVTLAPMRHWAARHLLDRNKALWAAFVIETPAGRIYHVADSGYGEGTHFRSARERRGPFRLAILPIGAYEPRWFMSQQHMNPEESVKAFLDCGAELALGHHYGTLQLTDEPIDAPVKALAAARRGCRDRAGALPRVTAGRGVEAVITFQVSRSTLTSTAPTRGRRSCPRAWSLDRCLNDTRLKRQSTAYRYVSTGSYIANNIDRISALGANWTRAVGGNDVNDPLRSSGRVTAI